ncbi:GDSL esterase/lipase [Actinidia chinensis var. chinensis]|uniref:GDSL esterase/lipase n=1 Tax=Actinidia chinensis var. chinensis TaxID=1590841 RepID=A0A2R6QWI2_ACTCC|nr:GDSL esterase/lipase [Actinidia chinensis var. chinensis]
MAMQGRPLAVLVIVNMAAAALSASLLTFIFGDSLTEVGNNNFLQYSLAKSNFPYYGIDYPGGQATGRFTNGRTIGDIISPKLGIPSPPAYLSLLPTADAILCSNDYVNNFLQPFLADSQQYTHDEFVGLLTATLEQHLVRLYQLGARKMVFHGLGPLGCIPSQRVKSRRGQCLTQVNQWVQKFNSRVQNLIASLNRHLPSAQMSFADTYQAVLDLITNPNTYGFKVSNTSCCKVDTSLGGLCLPNSKLCSNQTEYVFWDAFHPSDAANAILAEKFFSSLFSNSTTASSVPSH